MVGRRFGRIVNITSAMVKTPLAPMGLSTGARAGLTSLSKALSRQVAHANVTLNNLLPERINTDRQKFMAELRAKTGGVSIEQAYSEMAQSIAAGRLGEPEEFGDACAFLCSAQAGYISGQNLQVDGGSYAGSSDPVGIRGRAAEKADRGNNPARSRSATRFLRGEGPANPPYAR